MLRPLDLPTGLSKLSPYKLPAKVAANHPFENLMKEKARAISLTIIGILAIVFLYYLSGNYYIKAYSDPFVWITVAKNLNAGGYLVKMPLAYALYLRAVMTLAGPVFVFLANLPIIIISIILLLRLAFYAGTANHNKSYAYLLAATTLACLFNIDPNIFTLILNPYRDPLSYLFILLSASLFLRYNQNPRHAKTILILAAICTGLAFCVKEPSILFVFPLAIYGYCSWYYDRKIKFWPTVILFTIVLTLSVTPIFIQSYLKVGHGFLPPQSAAEKEYFPGIHFELEVLYRGLYRSLLYYWSNGGIVGIIGFVLGIYHAITSRNRIILCLFIPTVAAFYLLYSIYWSFVPRYFFIVTLFATPITAYGLLQTVTYLADFLHRPALRSKLQAALPTILAISAIYSFLANNQPYRTFQIPQALALRAATLHLIPTNATVFAAKPLCAIFSVILNIESRPLNIDLSDKVDNTLATINPILAASNQIFYTDVANKGRHEINFALIKQVTDTKPVFSLPVKQYRFDDLTDADQLITYKITAWTNTSTTCQIPATNIQPNTILQFDAKAIWNKSSPRTYAHLQINNTILTTNIHNGINYCVPDWGQFTPPYTITLLSDAPIPNDLAPTLLDPTKPIILNFMIDSQSSFRSYLTAGFFMPTNQFHGRPCARWRDTATVELPAIYPAGDQIAAIFSLRAYPIHSNAVAHPYQFIITPPSGPAQKFDHKQDTGFHAFTIHYEANANNNLATISYKELPSKTGKSTPPILDLDTILLIDTSRRLTINIGACYDSVYGLHGFYSQERFQNTFARWTKRYAEMQVLFNPDGSSYEVNVYAYNSRPTNTPPANVQLLFNDRPLEVKTTSLPETKQELYIAYIDNSWFQPTSNRFAITCKPWKPKEYLPTSDDRDLGIMLGRIEFKAVTNAAPEAVR